MKHVYIAEPDSMMVNDLVAAFELIDKDGDRYQLHINPLGTDIIELCPSYRRILAAIGQPDLMIFPLHLSAESLANERACYTNVDAFDGVNLGRRYRQEGYEKPFLLTTVDYNSGLDFAIQCLESNGEPRLRHSCGKLSQIPADKSERTVDGFHIYASMPLNAYAPIEDFKAARLLHVLEGMEEWRYITAQALGRCAPPEISELDERIARAAYGERAP